MGHKRRKNKQLMKKNLLIIFILLASLFVRVFRLELAPSRLTHDEMSIGYNAFSILKTGRDEWGRSFPLTFEAFGDQKLPGYIYATVPFIGVFGLSVLALKLPSILAGIVIVYLGYALTLKTTKSHVAGLATAVILALSPWSIHLSRMALESNLALAAFAGGFWFLLSLFESKKPWWHLALAGILFAVAGYTYVAFRLTIVLLLLLITVMSLRQKQWWQKIALVWITLIVVMMPILPQILGKSGTARFSQISIFKDGGVEAKVLEQQNFCFMQNPVLLPKLCKVFFNKYYYLGEKLTKNYIGFLLPSFLFIDGDKLEYLNDPDFAEFFIILLPFYFWGLFKLIKTKTPQSKLLIGAYLITPVASALAGEPQIVRGSGLLIFVALLAGLGFSDVMSQIKQLRWQIIGITAVTGIFACFAGQYFLSYQYIYSARSENYFYQLDKRTVSFLNQVDKDFDTIYITNHFPDAHILLAFYHQIDPKIYQEQVQRPQPDNFGFSHPTKLGKYEFGGLGWHDVLCRDQQKTLFVTFGDNLPSTWKIAGQPFALKDFSNVHTQVQFYNLVTVRNYLNENQLLQQACGD